MLETQVRNQAWSDRLISAGVRSCDLPQGFFRGTLELRNTRSSRTIQDWKVTASSGGGFPSISTCQPPETRPRSKLTKVNTLERPTKFGLGRDNRVRHQGAKLPRHRRSYAAIWWERISHASNSDLLATSNPNLELKPIETPER